MEGNMNTPKYDPRSQEINKEIKRRSEEGEEKIKQEIVSFREKYKNNLFNFNDFLETYGDLYYRYTNDDDDCEIKAKYLKEDGSVNLDLLYNLEHRYYKGLDSSEWTDSKSFGDYMYRVDR